MENPGAGRLHHLIHRQGSPEHLLFPVRGRRREDDLGGQPQAHTGLEWQEKEATAVSVPVLDSCAPPGFWHGSGPRFLETSRSFQTLWHQNNRSEPPARGPSSFAWSLAFTLGSSRSLTGAVAWGDACSHLAKASVFLLLEAPANTSTQQDPVPGPRACLVAPLLSRAGC